VQFYVDWQTEGVDGIIKYWKFKFRKFVCLHEDFFCSFALV
jgi:hypothetical protein